MTSAWTARARQFPEDAGPLAHPVRPQSYIEINNFYTATVYEKGAELVRMIQTICGPKGFRKGMDLYFKRHDGDAATIEDFIACFADAAKIDFSQFATWYHQAGTPELVCTVKHNAKAETFELAIEQVLPPTPGEPKKKPLHIPVKIGLIGRDGREQRLRLASGETIDNGVLHLTKRSQKFRFTGLAEAPVPSLMRGFSAPVNLTIDLSDDDLAFLMTHDTDPFARWQAAVDYATRILVAMSRDAETKSHLPHVDAYAAALGAALDDDALGPAYIAELLRLPSEADIARAVRENVDPAAVLAARKAFAKRLGQKLGAQLEALYAANDQSGRPYAPDAASAGQRAARNIALALLSARAKTVDLERLDTHFTSANNMTDQASALQLLTARGGAAAKDALAQFRAQWAHDHIVIDTWFSVQATAPVSGALATVKRLVKDDLYSATTPNKIRAVVGAFAMFNPSQFNRANGAGYDFVAKQALAIDKINPQVAARLLNAFRSWRTLEPARRALAEAAVRRIAETEGLSRDVYEIASKMIED